MIPVTHQQPIIVFVIVEGQTEERFIKDVVACSLKHLAIILKPQIMGKEGGNFSYTRLKRHASNTLRANPDAIVSTFMDLYELRNDFPEFEQAKKLNSGPNKAAFLQQALRIAIESETQCREGRFVPYIQSYEYEALLFADVDGLCSLEPEWTKSREALLKMRNAFDTPEEINGGVNTHPSQRLIDAFKPSYKKIRHGPLAANKITLAVIERECPHFAQWMSWLRGLANSSNCMSAK